MVERPDPKPGRPEAAPPKPGRPEEAVPLPGAEKPVKEAAEGKAAPVVPLAPPVVEA
jgi:hypothetical protein